MASNIRKKGTEMNVLQLGPTDWSKQYQIPEDINWKFNKFSEKKKQRYDVVIITGRDTLTAKEWEKLQWLTSPYSVLYLPSIKNELSKACKHFLRCQAALKIDEEPQALIDHLTLRYFFGQSGLRISPQRLILKPENLNGFEYLDSTHLRMQVNSKDSWLPIGTYMQNLYIDPNRLVKLWLEMKKRGDLQVQLRLFIQERGGDGDPNKSIIVKTDSMKEKILPIGVSSDARFASVVVEVKGTGQLTLGVLHSRWAREGYGEFIAGGQRLIDEKNREDIAYYFNPGDLKPPLNVYFSGARGLEGFEAYPLFRKLHTPTILFTDMRQSLGSFYVGESIERQIKQVIVETLKKLGFTKDQLIMSGISMGTYPAIKLGAELQAYMISVAKPICNLGLVANRGRLERPDSFDTIYDIDNTLVPELDSEHLKLLDKQFWEQFDRNDLSNTRFFIGYMMEDDYDNQAVKEMSNSKAIANSRQLVAKGYHGRHNDDPEVMHWMFARLGQVLQNNFGRKV